MIYDCFSFFNELDILEIRLNTLNEVVDKFVLVEAPWTHRTGKAKPLYFAENKNRFAPFLHKIIHVIVSANDLPSIKPGTTEIEMGWIRENIQRNCITKGLTDAKPNDILIIADLDEIPYPDIVKVVAQKPIGISNIVIRNFSYFLNYANSSTPYHYSGPQILTYATFLNPKTYDNTPLALEHPTCANPIPSATLIRFSPYKHHIKGGWHFSSQGGYEGIKRKLNSVVEGYMVSHKYQENAYAIQQCVKKGKSIDAYPVNLCPEPIEHNFPRFIIENKERFAAQLLPATEKSWRAGRLTRLRHRIQKIIYDTMIRILICVIPKTLHPIFRLIRRKIGM